ncbi:hypothetical protein BASA50_005618 [Batrachochytrium salamandrivorans]|uniref:Uncharacterized protein n=1 Tax=Batrachochytrium salamandrivorans TaxID=1357716 RepID=A0ABQ8FCK4_9FUNG|nr:hypothetical protein BASA62_008327 [Batrachochytrium salamandrivorans]KAH6576030.1 hypothetical protein BASA60_004690 [Batrachochytrium salamandrivorans]KAH6588148.1 hypothetical protein BASA61_006094 [Batrachochytrium salamandrivorans]KAH6595717.1 hypothetical protein BASA50_005618 [Batrachochytrium salamandrivorans]KAH9244739.1 hypothetical protein BASA81_017842 [Batrachochytrium salamandrivorans]
MRLSLAVVATMVALISTDPLSVSAFPFPVAIARQSSQINIPAHSDTHNTLYKRDDRLSIEEEVEKSIGDKYEVLKPAKIRKLRPLETAQLWHNVSLAHNESFGDVDEPYDELTVTLVGNNPRPVYERDPEHPKGVFFPTSKEPRDDYDRIN